MKFANAWVLAYAMTLAAGDHWLWPSHLCYIFDTADPKASRAVVLSTYDTFVQRTIITTWKPKVEYKPLKKTYVSKWANVIGTAILDKRHKLCHQTTQLYVAVKLLAADSHWFLTATPIVNSFFVNYISLYRCEQMLMFLSGIYWVYCGCFGQRQKMLLTTTSQQNSGWKEMTSCLRFLIS